MNRDDKDKAYREELGRRINEYFDNHSQDLKDIANSVSHLFEAYCYVLIVQYYQEHGYKVVPQNLLQGSFRFRFSTSGNPWNYSYFTVQKSDSDGNGTEAVCDIWHNQLVEGAWSVAPAVDHEPPLFAADVAIVNPGSLPTTAPPDAQRKKGDPVSVRRRRWWAKSNDVLTFGEAKNLKAYPMLLAQFYGIVHEIKPSFLSSAPSVANSVHPNPVLFTNEHLTSGTVSVIRSLANRKICMCVVPEVCTSEDRELLELIEGGLAKLLQLHDSMTAKES